MNQMTILEGKVQFVYNYVIIQNIHQPAADSECTVSVGTVLPFFTGADTIPPLGYTSAVLNFNQYPTASTCAVELTLPTKHTQYEQFKKQLDVALQCMEVLALCNCLILLTLSFFSVLLSKRCVHFTY